MSKLRQYVIPAGLNGSIYLLNVTYLIFNYCLASLKLIKKTSHFFVNLYDCLFHCKFGRLGPLDISEWLQRKEVLFRPLGFLQFTIKHHVQFADVLFVVAHPLLNRYQRLYDAVQLL